MNDIRRRARGSALILAVVTVLVLTIVAVGLAFFTSTEDKISGNDKIQKEGFYAAEAGLRQGETLLSGGSMNTPSSISKILASSLSIPPTGGSPNTLDLKDGGYPAVLLKVGGTEYRDQSVTFASASSEKPYYTLYIRNDTEDKGPGKGDAVTDTNKIINLISVGYVQLPSGQKITKIIEEQLIVDVGTGSGYEKGANEGGTNG